MFSFFFLIPKFFTVKSAGNKIEPAKAYGQMKMSQMNAKGPNQQKQQQQKSNQQQQLQILKAILLF